MRINAEDTPPSSLSGDEVDMIDDEEVIYLGDADEVLDQWSQEEPDDNDFEVESLPPKDDATLVFSRHTGSVFCAAFHPQGTYAVTGGEDDKAFVWRIDTGQILHKCEGHRDSVIFGGFSFDGAFVSTADMCGVIKVWKCNYENEQQWPLVWEFEAGDLTWGKWHPNARVLLFGTVDGTIYIFKIPSGETKVLQGHSVKVEAATLFPDGLKLAAGYDDGSIKVWDIRSEVVLTHICPEVDNGHSTSVTCIDVHKDNNLIVSGSSEGKLLLSTASTGKCVGVMSTEADVESVVCCKEPDLPYVASGTLNGAVDIWDIARQVVRHRVSARGDDTDGQGVTRMLWVRERLVTGGLDGVVRVYCARSGARLLQLTGHRAEILDLAYDFTQDLLLTTSEDCTARIFNFKELGMNDEL